MNGSPASDFQGSVFLKAHHAAASETGFALPFCSACGHDFYPSQSWCPHCLACNTGYRPDSGEGVVISSAELRVSFDARWRAILPVHVACVLLTSGIRIFVRVRAPLRTASQVKVRLEGATKSLPSHWMAEPIERGSREGHKTITGVGDEFHGT